MWKIFTNFKNIYFYHSVLNFSNIYIAIVIITIYITLITMHHFFHNNCLNTGFSKRELFYVHLRFNIYMTIV